jgi:hypothetical protein
VRVAHMQLLKWVPREPIPVRVSSFILFRVACGRVDESMWLVVLPLPETETVAVTVTTTATISVIVIVRNNRR